MKRGIAFLGLALCLFVMNSCAGIGAVVTVDRIWCCGV